MFFVIIFLSLASLASYFFRSGPGRRFSWRHWAASLPLRLALFFADRSSKAAGKTPQP